MTRASRALAATPAALAQPPSPNHNPEQVRRLAEEVLSRPEFRSGRSPLEIAVEWLRERLEQLIRAIMEAAGGGVFDAIAIGLLVLLAAGIGVLVWRGLRGMTPEGASAAGEAARVRPATDWHAEAEAHERAGAWRQALRCRYRALIAELASRGLVEEVPGTTAGEYRWQVQRNVPAAAADFSGATELFELAWYGRAPTGEEESASFRRLAGRVLVAAGR